MGKKEIREVYLKRRNHLSKSDIERKSALIREKLFSNEFFIKASTVFAYVSFGSEVMTRDIIETSLNIGKKVALPVTIPREKKMEFIRVEDTGSLRKSKFGVLEPAYNSEAILNGGLEAIILVPGIAFDKEKYRIGYGGGYYDKYLKENKFLKSIGLCFSEQIIAPFRKECHDIDVELLITEEDIYV